MELRGLCRAFDGTILWHRFIAERDVRRERLEGGKPDCGGWLFKKLWESDGAVGRTIGTEAILGFPAQILWSKQVLFFLMDKFYY